MKCLLLAASNSIREEGFIPEFHHSDDPPTTFSVAQELLSQDESTKRLVNLVN